MSERVFLISDIHIGNPQFDNEQLLMDFLSYVKKAATGLIINGDFLDFQQGPPAKILIDFDGVLSKLFELAKTDLNIWYIVGNHDILLQNFVVHSELMNIIYPRLDLEIGGRLVHIEHGHLFDKYYRRMPWLYNLGSRLLGLGLRFNPQLGDELGSIFSNLQSARYQFAVTPASQSYQGDFSEYESGARDILLGKNKKKAPTKTPDIVTFGHTHRPLVKEFAPDKLYINSGCWIKHATYIEFSDAGIFLGDWKQKSRRLLRPGKTSSKTAQTPIEN